MTLAISKLFGHRSGLTECQSLSESKQFDTLIVFLNEIFEKVNFEKKSADKIKPSQNGEITLWITDVGYIMPKL